MIWRSDVSRTAEVAYDPKSWVAGVWTAKSDGTRSALKGIRRFGEATSVAQPKWLMTRRAG
ncbi:hypothetical protein [Planomicrobium okeanokoites]|uniref:hypothetical protein n=1 Tax=Planomicrobium okeanokoites TaxID=244 RepID=UPI002491726A|nr:hypothetical protein [Planomicrobium okeanokoites]